MYLLIIYLLTYSIYISLTDQMAINIKVR